MEKLNATYQSYNIAVYHKQGETNEKIVFLHGGGLDHALLSWKEVIECMGDQYDIYAIDLLGYGDSDKPELEYSIPLYVDLLYNVLAQLNIQKTHLIGLSMGGGIGIGFSLEFPDMVDKLVLVGAFGLYERMPFHALCRWYAHSWLNEKSYEWMGKSKQSVRWNIEASLIGDKNRISDQLVTTLYDLLQKPGCNKPFASLQRNELGKKKMTTPLASRLHELSKPVLIVNGEKDAGVPVKSAIAAHKTIANSHLYIMQGCKHWAQKERPEEFAKVAGEFLARQ